MGLTLDRHMKQMQLWSGIVYATCPSEEYIDVVALPWFERIGPERAAQYGVVGLNELGVPGVLAQVMNCYFRWLQMEEDQNGMSAMLDVFRDSLGFAVLTAIVAGRDPEEMARWECWDENVHPSIWYGYLKNVWDNGSSDHAMAAEFALAFSMFRATARRRAI